MIMLIITIAIIFFIISVIFSKDDGKADLNEANRRRKYIIGLSESEIIKFADEKGTEELGQWINYKDLLEDTDQIKYRVAFGFEDNEVYWWYKIIRKSDGKCIRYSTKGFTR